MIIKFRNKISTLRRRLANSSFIATKRVAVIIALICSKQQKDKLTSLFKVITFFFTFSQQIRFKVENSL